DEMIRGRLVQALPCLEPHGDTQWMLPAVLEFHLEPGYVGSTELLTRVAPKSDFATDACIRREGADPDTGGRYLEELAFEVVNEQSAADILAKAEDMIARGARRVFAIFVKKGEVKEWRGAWQNLPLEGVIEDPCFAVPVPVKAVL